MTPAGTTPSAAADDHPPHRSDDYRSSVLRSPSHPPVVAPATVTELTGPGPVEAALLDTGAEDADLTRSGPGESTVIGARTIITGHVLDQRGEPLPGVVIDIWQADASGRYNHWRETEYPAPRDPAFRGVGRVRTGGDGVYRFLTIRPGPYPWANHPNAWRPAHIHLSVLGPTLRSRLVTQLYFPGDPLLELDPIFRAVPLHSRHRLVCRYDHEVSEPNWATGYRFDIVLAGADATPRTPT
ncbi:MAG: protocatechuate 3,4-dioxygenase subunit beta [Acidimicrobiales bacterium]